MGLIAELIHSSNCQLWSVTKLLIYHFLSQAPLFKLDQEEDEEEDVLSMKSKGKEEKML